MLLSLRAAALGALLHMETPALQLSMAINMSAEFGLS